MLMMLLFELNFVDDCLLVQHGIHMSYDIQKNRRMSFGLCMDFFFWLVVFVRATLFYLGLIINMKIIITKIVITTIIIMMVNYKSKIYIFNDSMKFRVIQKMQQQQQSTVVKKQYELYE
jgi:hypothetical protein